MCVGLSGGMSTPRIRGIDSLLALPLLVPRVGANHQQLAVPADQLAVLADTLDARTHFHVRLTAFAQLPYGSEHLRKNPISVHPRTFFGTGAASVGSFTIRPST